MSCLILIPSPFELPTTLRGHYAQGPPRSDTGSPFLRFNFCCPSYHLVQVFFVVPIILRTLPSDPGKPIPVGICTRTVVSCHSLTPRLKPGATISVAAMRLNFGVPKRQSEIAAPNRPGRPLVPVILLPFRPIPANQSPSSPARGRRCPRHFLISG